MEACRNQAQAAYPLTGAVRKFREFILQRMLPSPDLLETSMLPARLYQKLGIQWLVRHSHILKLGPEWISKAEGMMPELHPPLRPQLPDVVPAVGPRWGLVAFFLGCIMTLMYPEVSRQTVKVLTHQGFEVITPKDQKCCGAPHLNEGDRETTRRLALYNLELFMALDADAIVTDCAGCGAALKEYEELLEESGDHETLHAFRNKVKDISEFLAEQGLRTENLKPLDKHVT